MTKIAFKADIPNGASATGWYVAEAAVQSFTANGFEVEKDTHPEYSGTGSRVVVFSHSEAIYNIGTSVSLSTNVRALSFSLFKNSAPFGSAVISVNFKQNVGQTAGSAYFGFYFADSINLFWGRSYDESPVDFTASYKMKSVIRPKHITTDALADITYVSQTESIDLNDPFYAFNYNTPTNGTSKILRTSNISNFIYEGKIMTMPYYTSAQGTDNSTVAMYIPDMVCTSGFPNDAPNIVEIGGETYFRVGNTAIKW